MTIMKCPELRPTEISLILGIVQYPLMNIKVGDFVAVKEFMMALIFEINILANLELKPVTILNFDYDIDYKQISE